MREGRRQVWRDGDGFEGGWREERDARWGCREKEVGSERASRKRRTDGVGRDGGSREGGSREDVRWIGGT